MLDFQAALNRRRRHEMIVRGFVQLSAVEQDALIELLKAQVAEYDGTATVTQRALLYFAERLREIAGGCDTMRES